MPPPSHFILTPIGSTGDVFPFVGVGRELRARGHDVTLITAEPFRETAERAGLAFIAGYSRAEFETLERHPNLWHPRKGAFLVVQLAAQEAARLYRSIASVFQPRRSVLVGHLLSFGTRVFEDAHHAPAATLHLAPSAFRTLHQQPIFEPGRDWSAYPRWIKRTFWWVLDRLVMDPKLAPPINRLRRQVGLKPVSRVFKEWLHSPQRVIGLFPEWFGAPQPDWPRQLRLASFVLYDGADQQPLSPGLTAFLASGSAPVVFTAGTSNPAARGFFDAAVQVSERLGRRALLLTRFHDQLPTRLPAEMHHESFAPLSSVLPHAAGIVHHGGVGTCARGIAAGIPQLVVPFGFDQPDNAERLVRLGVGRWLEPRAFARPDAAHVLGALLADPAVAAACAGRATALRASRGIEKTCDLLEQVAASR